MRPIFIAAGGTFGHIRPALVLKKELEKEGLKVHLFCAKKDKRFPQLKLEKNVHYFNLSGLPRSKRPYKWVVFSFCLLISLIQSLYFFLRFNPKLVTGCGGFVSFPVLLWGRLFFKPYFIVEQNSIPGLVTRLFIKKAKQVFFAMQPVYEKYRTLKNAQLVGNPLDFEMISKRQALQNLGIDQSFETKKIIGVLGGSLGAIKINDFIVEKKDYFKAEGILCILITGKKTYENYKKYENENLMIRDFILEMPSFYAVCNLIIARAGASSVSELLFFNKSTIFIPYPHATENHQYHNAIFASDYIKSLIVDEKELHTLDCPEVVGKIENSHPTKDARVFNEAKNIIVKAIKKG